MKTFCPVLSRQRRGAGVSVAGRHEMPPMDFASETFLTKTTSVRGAFFIFSQNKNEAAAEK
jgi:hypothetical protein